MLDCPCPERRDALPPGTLERQRTARGGNTIMMRDSMRPVQPHAYKIPAGPCGYPIFGVLPRVWQHPLRYFTDAAHRYGEVISLPLGFRRVYLLNHPDHIKRVLQDQPDHYRKSVPRVARLKPLFG